MVSLAVPVADQVAGPGGLVARTLATSVVDGPGNRFVVFLQGCNFDCVNCHNPQTINVCDACAECLGACDRGALQIIGGAMHFDSAACDGCDRCLDACPYASSPMARRRSVDELLGELELREPFLSGVTVSGGEPTLQLAFLHSLFLEVKRHPRLRRLTTFVDSNGTLPPAGWDALAPWLDGAMVDLKAAHPATHRRITGSDNEAVLATIRHLHRLGKLHEVRLLVIEGLTDVADELAAYAAFVRSVDAGVRVRLMAYRHHGVRPQGRQWPETSPATMTRVEATLRDAGLAGVVSAPVW